MVDPRLMRGDGWIRCSLCGKLHEPNEQGEWPTLWRDSNGQLWDSCIECGEIEAQADVMSIDDSLAPALEEVSIPPGGFSAMDGCRIRGWHDTGVLLVDAMEEYDRVYRCSRCGAEWSPHTDPNTGEVI